MKRSIITALAVAGISLSGIAQGFLDFGNNFTGVFRAPVYNVNPLNPTESQTGQSSLGVPSGSTVYGGALLQSGYTMALFAGANAGSMTEIITQTFRTAASPTALPAGLVLGATVQVPGVLPGQAGVFEIRAFDNLGGTITSWAQAVSQDVARGTSGVFTTGVLGGTDGVSIFVNPKTIGWTSFSLAAPAVIPEPSTFALAGLGLASLVIFRRRK